MESTDFAKLLTDYLSKYLPGQRNLSKNTIKSYRDTFRLFLTYCKNENRLKPEKLCMSMITDSLICGFLNWLEQIRKCSIPTRNQRLAAIHAFFRYVQIEAPENLLMYQKILHIPSKKGSHKPMNYLSADALKEVLSQPDISTKNGRRDIMMLTLLYDSAARVQEIIDLKVRDIRLEEPAIITIFGKGRKVRCVPLMSKTKFMVENYLKEQELWQKAEKLDHPVFFNNRREKLTRAGVSYIVNKHVKGAKAENNILFPDTISPHVFRHTKAMHLLQANVNLIYIRDFLGHVNITTTEIYAKADAETKRKALENAYIDISEHSLPEWNSNKDLMDWLQNLCN